MDDRRKGKRKMGEGSSSSSPSRRSPFPVEGSDGFDFTRDPDLDFTWDPLPDYLIGANAFPDSLIGADESFGHMMNLMEEPSQNPSNSSNPGNPFPPSQHGNPGNPSSSSPPSFQIPDFDFTWEDYLIEGDLFPDYLATELVNKMEEPSQNPHKHPSNPSNPSPLNPSTPGNPSPPSFQMQHETLGNPSSSSTYPRQTHRTHGLPANKHWLTPRPFIPQTPPPLPQLLPPAFHPSSKELISYLRSFIHGIPLPDTVQIVSIYNLFFDFHPSNLVAYFQHPKRLEMSRDTHYFVRYKFHEGSTTRPNRSVVDMWTKVEGVWFPISAREEIHGDEDEIGTSVLYRLEERDEDTMRSTSWRMREYYIEKYASHAIALCTIWEEK